MRFWLLLILEIFLISLLFSACFPAEYSRKYVTFEHGGITADGFYSPDAEKSIVSKEKYECTKFRITRDYFSDFDLYIYYFDFEDAVVHVDKMTTSVYEIDYDTMPNGAEFIRIVLVSDEGFSDWDCFWKQFSFNLKVSTQEEGFWAWLW